MDPTAPNLLKPASSEGRAKLIDRGLQSTLFLFLIGLALRLVPVLLTPDLEIGLDDMFQYDMLARSLAEGDGFRWYAPKDLRPLLNALKRHTDLDLSDLQSVNNALGVRTSFRAPLYPAFLSLIYRLVDPSTRFFAARIVQTFILAWLGPLTFAIARQLGVGLRWSSVAGLLIAVWPLLVGLPLALATEALFLPLTAASLWLLLKAEGQGSKWPIIGAGTCLGLAALTRSVILGFPFLLALWYLSRRRLRTAAFLLAPILLIISPWIVRNSLHHGQPALIESSLGYNLYLGYHPETTGTFEFGPSLDLLTIVDDSARDQIARQQAWQFIRQEPGRVPRLIAWKAAHFWGLEDRAFSYLYSNDLLGRWPPVFVAGALLITSLPLVLTLPFAILGWSLTDRSRQWQILSLLFGWYVGIHLLVMAEERFHFSLLPMLAAFAALFFSQRRQLWHRLRRGDPSLQRRLLLATILLLMAFSSWGFEIDRNYDQYRRLIEPGGWQLGLHY